MVNTYINIIIPNIICVIVERNIGVDGGGQWWTVVERVVGGMGKVTCAYGWNRCRLDLGEVSVAQGLHDTAFAVVTNVKGSKRDVGDVGALPCIPST